MMKSENQRYLYTIALLRVPPAAEPALGAAEEPGASGSAAEADAAEPAGEIALAATTEVPAPAEGGDGGSLATASPSDDDWVSVAPATSGAEAPDPGGVHVAKPPTTSTGRRARSNTRADLNKVVDHYGLDEYSSNGLTFRILRAAVLTQPLLIEYFETTFELQ